MTGPNVPRIEPLPCERWPVGLLEAARAVVGGELRSDANVYRTLANAPAAFLAWLHLGSHLARRSRLDPPLREVVILRTSAIARGIYPFTQHVAIGEQVGLDATRIRATMTGSITPGLADLDGSAMQLVDEMMVARQVSAATWNGLQRSLDLSQCLDAVATVGFYRLASWVLNACGTPLDPGQESVLVGPAMAVSAELGQEPARLPTTPSERWPAGLIDATSSWPPEMRDAEACLVLACHPELAVAAAPLLLHVVADSSLSDGQIRQLWSRTCARDGRATILERPANVADYDADPDGVLVDLVDELHATNTVSAMLWDRLALRLTTEQRFDAIITTGIAGFLNSFSTRGT